MTVSVATNRLSWRQGSQGAHLVVAVTGDLDARLLHLHVHHQTFHHWQGVLVVTEVLRQEKGRQKKLGGE